MEVGRRAKIDGNRLRSFCIPDETTNGQVKDVVVNSLRDHPESRHLPTAVLIEVSLEQAFPCARQTK
jgi:hypothetical protein